MLEFYENLNSIGISCYRANCLLPKIKKKLQLLINILEFFKNIYVLLENYIQLSYYIKAVNISVKKIITIFPAYSRVDCGNLVIVLR